MKSVVTLLFTAVLFNATAQNLSKVGVSKMSLRNCGDVVQGGIVKGYYFFYKLEKVDSKQVNFLLTVVDENLNEINSVNIIRPKHYALVESAYNGSAFAFLFYDPRNKNLELISYDQALKQAGQYIEKITNIGVSVLYQQISAGVNSDQQFVVPVTQGGFLYYNFMPGTNNAYNIRYFSDELKTVWMTNGKPEGRQHLMAADAFQSSEYIGSIITNRKGRDLEYALLLQDRIKGSTIINTPLVTSKYSLSPSDVRYDSVNSEIVVFGEFHDRGDKELTDASKGFGSFVLTIDGKITNEKFLTWADLSKMAPVNESGKMDGSNTNIYFHDFIRTADGQIFGIGEQYKKVASGAGIAAKVIFGNYSGVATTTINVYNMVIFQFTPDYDIKKVHYFEKSKTRVPLPNRSSYLGAKRLSYYVKAVNGFDFAFDQQYADNNTFTATYVDFDRSEGGKRVVGSITYTPEKNFSVDKMVLAKSTSEMRILKGKPGYFVVLEYVRAEKRLEVRQEKINY